MSTVQRSLNTYLPLLHTLGIGALEGKNQEHLVLPHSHRSVGSPVFPREDGKLGLHGTGRLVDVIGRVGWELGKQSFLSGASGFPGPKDEGDCDGVDDS